jgi:hypothetical protein
MTVSSKYPITEHNQHNELSLQNSGSTKLSITVLSVVILGVVMLNGAFFIAMLSDIIQHVNLIIMTLQVSL